MKTPKIDRALLAGLVAGLAALSIASTCPHTGATHWRESHWDCRTCTAANTNGWVPISPAPTHCKGYKHEVRAEDGSIILQIAAWCKCSPNSKCEPTGATYPNQTWQETDVYYCVSDPNTQQPTGNCCLDAYTQDVSGTLAGKQTTGCGSN